MVHEQKPSCALCCEMYLLIGLLATLSVTLKTKNRFRETCIVLYGPACLTSGKVYLVCDLGPYSPTILNNILCFCLLHDCKLECDTTSDWLNRLV